MKELLITLLVSGVAALAFSGCYNDNREDLYPVTGDCDTATVTYAATIQPIISSKCATSGCHAGAIPTGIDLSGHSGLQTVAMNGKLLAAITHSGGASPMPKGMPKLDDCSIAKISKWVNSGAPNN